MISGVLGGWYNEHMSNDVVNETSGADPWGGVVFVVPPPARKADTPLRSPLGLAIVNRDPLGVRKAIKSMNKSSIRSSEVARQIARNFSEGCADVLYEENILRGLGNFDVVIEEKGMDCIAWWLSSEERCRQLQVDLSSNKHRRESFSQLLGGFSNSSPQVVLFNFMERLATKSPSDFLTVASRICWQAVAPYHGKSKVPVALLMKAFASPSVSVDDMRPLMEHVFSPEMLPKLSWGKDHTGKVPTPEHNMGQAMLAMSSVLFSADVPFARKIQELINSSPLLREAWACRWLEREGFVSSTSESLPVKIGVGKERESFQFSVKLNSFLVEQLSRSDTPTYTMLLEEDWAKPSTFGLHCIALFRKRPNVFSLFISNLPKTRAAGVVGGLAEHLWDVPLLCELQRQYGQYKVFTPGFSYAHVCLAQHPTSGVLRALAKNEHTFKQLYDVVPQGKRLIDHIVEGASELAKAEAILSAAKSKKLAEVAAANIKAFGVEEPPSKPRPAF